jgi:hypothetical protein
MTGWVYDNLFIFMYVSKNVPSLNRSRLTRKVISRHFVSKSTLLKFVIADYADFLPKVQIFIRHTGVYLTVTGKKLVLNTTTG